ncbi:MAG: helicase-related protein [Rhodospirillales bacterium]|nr:helicase-related protein [Rhodospirillales bacterium]MDE0381788.1 helicase-related protein [Rhodospirillales bacterium]
MIRHDAEDAAVTALLGPTNTGKTHLAVERMLAHRTGMMGFPLRLLAREVYDRVVEAKGEGAVALVTGEERRVPEEPRYFVCTVESMPLDRQVEFVAVDEIQLAGDRERGHIFTDRLLRARGTAETMFLGADTMRPLIRALVPEAKFTSRPRLSTLGHEGHCKLARLKPRNAVIAFSTESVYALAERIRGLRGGCAVVLGALSPRTRNAQVGLYQAGEVDSLVATDAIGMGLNLDLEHVAFSAYQKFDGRATRMLTSAEIAQIAGRAGRHLTDGSFGTTGGIEPFDPALVQAVENHRFPPVRRAYWRNADLTFESLPALADSLAAPPPFSGLKRTHDANDHRTLLVLARDPAVAETLTGADRIALLWEVCQIPDFRKTLAEDHVGLARRIYLSLVESGRLPGDWVARSIERLAPTEGDIDTLTARISHVRTWTYVSHRADWVDDARGWQERTRSLEDALSDALHAQLTQLFVSRRAGQSRHGRRMDETLFAIVGESGAVMVEGERAGVFDGFRFRPDADVEQSRGVLAAAHRVVEREVARRVAAAVADDDDAFALGLEPGRQDAPRWGEIAWRGASVGRLGRGDSPLRPSIALIGEDHLSAAQRERVRRRLQAWLDRFLARNAGPLVSLREASLDGSARGVAFALGEALGCLPRRVLAPQLAALDQEGRRALAEAGVRLGALSVFMPAMLKPARSRCAGLLWWACNGAGTRPPVPGSAVSMERDPAMPDACYAALGLVPLGSQVVRADIAERLAARLRKAARNEPFAVDPGLLKLAACKRARFDDVLGALGYSMVGIGTDGRQRFARTGPSRCRSNKPRRREERGVDPDSPFAKLSVLATGTARPS